MNEEEKHSIKFTKEYLEEEKKLRDDYKWKSGFYANGDIERLLNLIEKQQKEIKKLNDELKEERNFIKSALETLKDCVHKDRIRKIIEEYNKKCDECNFNKSGICKELKAYNCCSIQSVLELLKVLIGETK